MPAGTPLPEGWGAADIIPARGDVAGGWCGGDGRTSGRLNRTRGDLTLLAAPAAKIVQPAKTNVTLAH